MLKEMLRAFALIFAAEMGDKTQIIAMTFATQYSVKEVILGVILGVLCNHGIAIVMGSFLSKVVPMNLIQLIAGIMFVFFGIMALRDSDTEEIDNNKGMNPVLTVALAFFIGELGDKTQLTAMTLSSEGNFQLFILIGTTLGMVATSAMGIFIGSKIGDKVPDIAVKIVSSIVFIFFGTLKLFNTVSKEYITLINLLLYFIVILAIELYLIDHLIRKRKLGESPVRKAAANLYEQTKNLKEILDDLCLGENFCGHCLEIGCLLGYTRRILQEAREKGKYYIDISVDIDSLTKKGYNSNKVIQALCMVIVDSIKNNWDKSEDFVINRIRASLELVLFGEKLDFNKGLKRYLNEAKKKSEKYGILLEKAILNSLGRRF